MFTKFTIYGGPGGSRLEPWVSSYLMISKNAQGLCLKTTGLRSKHADI